MSHSFHQLHYHLVFALAFRDSVIHPSWSRDLYTYMGGIINSLSCHPIIINGMHDHVHILLSVPPDKALSDIAKSLKTGTNKWINCKILQNRGHFQWQQGCGYFSVSNQNIESVTNYITNQQTHHAKHSFLEEYTRFLNLSGKAYQPNQIFSELR